LGIKARNHFSMRRHSCERLAVLRESLPEL
jgi:hypothetical protein